MISKFSGVKSPLPPFAKGDKGGLKILCFLLFFLTLSLFAGKEEKDKNKCEKYIAKGYQESQNLTKKPVLKIDFSLKDYFPKAAKEKGIKTGKTIVQIFLNKKGKLVCTSILKKSEGYGFDEAATQIIRKAKFRPGEINGKHVDSVVALPVEFTVE
jgi:TonB family protein